MRPGCTRRRFVHALLSGCACWSTPGLAQRFVAGEVPLSGLGGDIRLTDHHGQAFVLSQQAAQPTLVFFGFTQCAQVCPPALSTMQALMARMKARKPVRMLFVTLDPLNDDPAALQRYLRNFDDQVIGLTGSPAQIEALARRYGVQHGVQGGVLDHSARLYLLGQDHRLVRVYRLQTPVAQLASDIVAVQAGHAYLE